MEDSLNLNFFDFSLVKRGCKFAVPVFLYYLCTAFPESPTTLPVGDNEVAAFFDILTPPTAWRRANGQWLIANGWTATPTRHGKSSMGTGYQYRKRCIVENQQEVAARR